MNFGFMIYITVCCQHDLLWSHPWAKGFNYSFLPSFLVSDMSPLNNFYNISHKFHFSSSYSDFIMFLFPLLSICVGKAYSTLHFYSAVFLCFIDYSHFADGAFVFCRWIYIPWVFECVIVLSSGWKLYSDIGFL
jgi:hypothetical protein